MMETLGRPSERAIRREDLIVTPKSLYEQNHSSEAKLLRTQWEAVRINGKLIAYYRCSDARLKPAGIGAVSWGSIAGADEPDTKFATSRGTQGSVALGHFDGDTVIQGEMPTGCGGLLVKREVGTQKNHTDAKKFVAETVKHEDVLIQSLLSAENVAILSNKPAIAAVQDHLTLQMHPIALFLPKGEGVVQTIGKVRVRDIVDKNYDPRRLYANGIPTIDISILPEMFQEILLQNLKDMQDVNSKYPDLRKLQKIQNPKAIFWSTDIRSARVKYPILSAPPGSIFKVIMPREKIEGNVSIQEDDIKKCLEQLSYAIKYAINNSNDPSGSFSDTKDLIIETGSIDESIHLARRAMEEPWMKEWAKLGEDRRITVVQSVGGIVADNIAYFTDQPKLQGI